MLLGPASGCPKPVAEALAQAILGHHAGLPDTDGTDGGSLVTRIARPGAALDAQWRVHLPDDFHAVVQEVLHKLRKVKAGFDFSVATRIVFSCLVDADFRDTEAYYDALEGRSRDRDLSALQSLLIDSPMVPVIVAREDVARDWVEKLSNDCEKSGPLARASSPDDQLVEQDFPNRETRQKITVTREILWESTTATKAEVLALERRLIVELRANDPSIGCNRRPVFRSVPRQSSPYVTQSKG
ncbi:hypothetical protein SAMN05877831_11856 [Rhodobacter maris]|uniref:HD Cas3-type domain-containing protein n=1 Tax=Rhodobacter maris TaxID=446682 RepID=A0A285TC97_9RHOB|nr:hypothetical protein SAMN05877831_11856 [Rhodobacter maris]